MNKQKLFSTISILLLATFMRGNARGDVVVSFEDLPLEATGFFNGDINGSAQQRANFTTLGTRRVFEGTDFETDEVLQLWSAGDIQFSNNFIPAFSSWSGWSWSSVQDAVTPGFENQYAAFPGGGATVAGGVQLGGKYAINSGGGYFNLPEGTQLGSLQVANATFTGTFVAQGDAFGAPFSSGDFLEVIVSGFDELGGTGNLIGSTTIALADFRNGQTSVLSSWLSLDSELNSFRSARSVEFSFADSRNGTSTPYYVALDNLRITAVPEPSSLVILGVVAVGLLGRRARRPVRLPELESADDWSVTPTG